MRMAELRWLYYVVDHAWVARVSEDGVKAQLLRPDGCWEPLSDVGKVLFDGRQVASEEAALEEAREIFELRCEPHALDRLEAGGGPAETATGATPGAQPGTVLSNAASMDYRNIPLFFTMFLDTPSFSVEDAVKLLGAKQDTSLPDRIVLEPSSPDVSWAQLETCGRFLEGVSIDFAVGHYPSVSFAALIRDYGEPQQFPLPPPMLPPGGFYHANYSYSFDGRRALSGELIVTVEGERKGDFSRAAKVIYRRWPRPTHAAPLFRGNSMR